ncbi:MAG: hypothetical protein E6325_26770, partial [Enterobacteriaceae bacterium]|nr:hypothetical protein [Enterobacteriaceae bacterium]
NGGLLIRMSLVRVQSEEPNLKTRLRQLKRVFAFQRSARRSFDKSAVGTYSFLRFYRNMPMIL